MIRRKVIVNLKTDKSFEGVLWKKRFRYVALKGATVHEAGQQAEVEGMVVIDRSNIDFIQVANG